MSNLIYLGLSLLAYLVGSIPFGFLLVRIFTDQDLREIESGRTGGTNSMRAAGFSIGFATSMLDVLKSACMVWLAKIVLPGDFWLHVFIGLFVVIGHNYSIFLIQKDSTGKWKVGGGAGGTPAVGALVGLWWPSILVLVPAGYLIVMVIGYASVATISLPLLGSLLFLIRFLTDYHPWEYVFSGLLSEIFILWALRPNIKRLINGTERIVGFRAKKRPTDEGP